MNYKPRATRRFLFISIAYFSLCSSIFSQRVGINTDSISNAAVFEIQSDSLGILIPRLDSSMIHGMVSPPPSLLVYQKNKNTGYKYFDGDVWKSLDNEVSIIKLNNRHNTIDTIINYINQYSISEAALFYEGSIINPTKVWFWNSKIIINIKNNEASESIKQYYRYEDFRNDTLSVLTDIIFINDFTVIYNQDTSRTIGGFFVKKDEGLENGGIILVNKTGVVYERVWDKINVIPDWWEIGGYDHNGKKYKNDFKKDGVQCDFDRVVCAASIDVDANLMLPLNREYLQWNKDIYIKSGTTIFGNNSIIKRAPLITTITSGASNGSTQYQVEDASKFRIGMRVSGFLGTAVGQNDRSLSFQYNTISDIQGNTIYLELPIEKNIPANSKFQITETQMLYGDNVTIANLIFDGNKNSMNATESWNFVNCLKSSTKIGLSIRDCKFFNMPSDCITTAGETWITNCIVKNLNACFVHGSSGTGDTYSQSGVYIDNVKADSICLSTAATNGHTSQHGFYVQSIGTHGIKINNCRISNIMNGGVFSPLTTQSDEFSLTNSHIENASHIVTNISTSGVTELVLTNNTIINCGVNPIGSSLGATGIYNKVRFVGNTILNAVFQFSGIEDGIYSDNTFRLEQNEGHANFGNSELSIINPTFWGLLHVEGRNNSVSNNNFYSLYEDPTFYTAISYNASNTEGSDAISISNNLIDNFSTGIRSTSGGTGTVRSGVNITNNNIKVLESPANGGFGIHSYFNAIIKGNTIENKNAVSSIKVYGNQQDPMEDLGCKVIDNFCFGSKYAKMIDVIYRNNIIENNIVEGSINYINATYKTQNIVGENRQFDSVTRTFQTIPGN